MAGARSYTDKTLKRLFGLACNRCSYPGCEKIMTDSKSAISSNICHIEAANEGGERWNKNMTDVQRADYENLILLCPTHHQVTNDIHKYTVEVLKEIKRNHEKEMESRTSIDRPLSKRPSLITEVINKISDIDIDEIDESPVTNSFSISEKISYNNIILNRSMIEEYKVYQGKINSIYSEFERSGSIRKEKILRSIRHIYIKAKGVILGADLSISNIRKNSDNIIEFVKRNLHENIDESSNNDADAPYEDIEFVISIIVVDCFLRCKVLEEPKGDH